MPLFDSLPFASDLLRIEESRPTLIDPAKFGEAFADAKRAHIDRERQDIINDFPTILILSIKKTNSKITPKKQLLGEANWPRLHCLP